MVKGWSSFDMVGHLMMAFFWFAQVRISGESVFLFRLTVTEESGIARTRKSIIPMTSGRLMAILPPR
jgi:hypothetical protein